MSQKQEKLSVTEPTEGEEGKTSPIEGKKEEGKPPTPTEVAEQTVDPEKLKQQLKTHVGLLQQAQTRLKELEKQHLDFDGLKSAVDGIQSQVQEIGETLTLHTDVLNQMGEGNEELQKKVAAQRQVREGTHKLEVTARQARTLITEVLQLADINADTDEEAKPVREAFVEEYSTGNYPKTMALAKLVVKTKISAMKIASPSTEQDKAQEKVVPPKQKVITKTPTVPVEELSSRQKIIKGVVEKRENL